MDNHSFFQKMPFLAIKIIYKDLLKFLRDTPSEWANEQREAVRMSEMKRGERVSVALAERMSEPGVSWNFNKDFR